MPYSNRTEVPRPEYPRPQFRRHDWLCLNGWWEFEIDKEDRGFERGVHKRSLSSRILVPFAPESDLSGVGETDFLNAVWYRREVAVPAAWAGRRILLHFGACDYETTVWANGQELGRHRGGYTPFSFELPASVTGGQHVTLVVRAQDDHRENKASGKQTHKPENFGCYYTRTTGIWQTVWMEPVGEARIGRPRITPLVAESAFVVESAMKGAQPGSVFVAVLTDVRGVVSKAATVVGDDMSSTLRLEVPAERRRLWCTADPHLYGLQLSLRDPSGAVVDYAESYAGLRSVALGGGAILINGKPLFQKLVLDQGLYPDGLMTAPDEAALVRDIELALAAGFNGARLHQKVFEERFLYHADRLGYMVWGEFPDWAPVGHWEPEGKEPRRPSVAYLGQWLEAVERDYSHPCIVGWCPLNETGLSRSNVTEELQELTRAMYYATKAADRTRPVIDASGWAHVVAEADVYDIHDYEQDGAVLERKLRTSFPPAGGCDAVHTPNVPWRGQPFLVSEFGGIWWNPEAKAGEDSWGYGNRPRTLEEFHARFAKLCSVLLRHPKVAGYCYTQLTDTFQEQNGLFHFDRRYKFDLELIRAVQAQQAAVESRVVSARRTGATDGTHDFVTAGV